MDHVLLGGVQGQVAPRIVFAHRHHCDPKDPSARAGKAILQSQGTAEQHIKIGEERNHLDQSNLSPSP